VEPGIHGSGVVIGIIDDGVDGTNYDIAPNYRADLSRNFSDNAALAAAAQGPQKQGDNHGTAVAGVAAARGGNGIGGTVRRRTPR
jgi:subtilisin family serine protease